MSRFVPDLRRMRLTDPPAQLRRSARPRHPLSANIQCVRQRQGLILRTMMPSDFTLDANEQLKYLFRVPKGLPGPSRLQGWEQAPRCWWVTPWPVGVPLPGLAAAGCLRGGMWHALPTLFRFFLELGLSLGTYCDPG